MERKPRRFAQALIDAGSRDPECKIYVIPYDELKYEDLEPLSTVTTPHGLSAGYNGDSGRLAALAVVSEKLGVVIEFPEPPRRQSSGSPQPVNTDKEYYQVLVNFLASQPAGEFFAFDLAPLSMALYIEQGLRLTNAVDIQSAFPKVNRYSIAAILKAALGDTKIWESNLAKAFDNITYDSEVHTACLEPVKRAWLAQYLGSVDDAIMTYSSVERVNTVDMDISLLDVISKITTDSHRLENKKPDRTDRDFTYKGYDPENKKHAVSSNVFKNRFPIGGPEKVRVIVEDPSGSFAARGKVDGMGRKAYFDDGGLAIGDRVIKSIIGLGRAPPTRADNERDRSLLRLLQRLESPDNPWLQNIWFVKDAESIVWPETWFANIPKRPSLSPSIIAGLSEAAQKLNPSQQVAVNAMISKSPENVVTIVQGPPGTGKTSVIAFYVQMSRALNDTGTWLVAQSNVAVRNIAEKLMKVGFHDYRLLVADGFKKDWHDHLYQEILPNIIESSEFTTCASRIRGIRVFLCTLSMLSSSAIHRMFTKECPLKTLIIDEASQIHVGDYVSVFYKNPGLRKVCFIGDDKQLPPFGQDDDPNNLPSIFEVNHLRDHAYFLNTQYRMPPQMGDLISGTVYDSHLRSFSGHVIKKSTIATHFVDVPSREKRKDDSYWNEDERDIVLQIAKHLQDQEMDYKIISPYDAQRNAIESKMRNSPDLNWENKCFNVDSFQGNEEDYIIVSLVRSKEIGFLRSQRRTNVMLTRFKKGMFVVTSRKFLMGPGAECLVGEIAQQVGDEGWLSINDVAKGKFFGPRKISK